METIYANGRSGKYAAIEISGKVATMTKGRGVSTSQALKALARTVDNWTFSHEASGLYFFRKA